MIARCSPTSRGPPVIAVKKPIDDKKSEMIVKTVAGYVGGAANACKCTQDTALAIQKLILSARLIQDAIVAAVKASNGVAGNVGQDVGSMQNARHPQLGEVGTNYGREFDAKPPEKQSPDLIRHHC